MWKTVLNSILLSLLATHACSRHPIRFSLYPSWAPDAVHDGIYCRILGSCSFPYFWKLHISINSHFAVVVISMLLLVKLCCGCTSFVVHPWVSSLWNVKNSSKLNPSFASGYSSVLATPSSIQFVSKLGTWRCAWWNLLLYFGKLQLSINSLFAVVVISMLLLVNLFMLWFYKYYTPFHLLHALP